MLGTVETHRRAFATRDARSVCTLNCRSRSAWCRVRQRKRDRLPAPSALGAIRASTEMPGLVFEAHSTDYRTWFRLLKVGPELTFAMREALYGLDYIAGEMGHDWKERSVEATMEAEMLADPGYWAAHYSGEPDHERVLWHFSYSDRIATTGRPRRRKTRYNILFSHLDETGIPAVLVSQFLPALYPRVFNGRSPSSRGPWW